MKEKRLTVRDIMSRKGQQPIVMLTAYTAPMAYIVDKYADIILVGDSLGMVIYGLDSTIGVTLEMMIEHTKAVMRVSQKALVVVDMPFGTYQESPAQAYHNCARVLIETGAAAVKLEGGAEMAETTQFLAQRGIPVMAHIGLMPQHVNSIGGYRYQGRTESESGRIMQDAAAHESAGAFSLLLEALKTDVSNAVITSSRIPCIGIGASPDCDGQVLVIDDILGLTQSPARFVKKYANLYELVEKAVADYAGEVRSRKFPTPEHCY